MSKSRVVVSKTAGAIWLAELSGTTTSELTTQLGTAQVDIGLISARAAKKAGLINRVMYTDQLAEALRLPKMPVLFGLVTVFKVIAGLINMTKSFAKLLGPQGIVVNAVAAGPVATDMLAIIPEPRKKAIKEAVYTGRFAEPEEVAETMFWLATDCPEYINGTCVDINNGAFPR